MMRKSDVRFPALIASSKEVVFSLNSPQKRFSKLGQFLTAHVVKALSYYKIEDGRFLQTLANLKCTFLAHK